MNTNRLFRKKRAEFKYNKNILTNWALSSLLTTLFDFVRQKEEDKSSFCSLKILEFKKGDEQYVANTY